MTKDASPGWRLIPPFWLMVAVGLMFALHHFAPVAHWIPRIVRWLGVLPMVAGVALVIACAVRFKRAGTTLVPHEQPTALVTDGPFRFSRNPIYLGMLVFLAGVAMALGSLTPFLVIPAFAAWIHALFIVPEERRLEAAFGDAYRDYARRVRAWL